VIAETCGGVFGFAWLIGPGIFRGNCPLGNFKGRYAGRIGRQDWESLDFLPVQRSTPMKKKICPLKIKSKLNGGVVILLKNRFW
jgi:hypothetical protein